MSKSDRTALVRCLLILFLVGVAGVITCGVIGSLSHLGYMRPQWADIAVGWGFAFGIVGFVALMATFAVAGDA